MLEVAECGCDCCEGGTGSGLGAAGGSTVAHQHQSRERARACGLPLRVSLSQLEFQLIRSGIAKVTVNALLERAKKTLLFDRRPFAILLGGETVSTILYCISSSLFFRLIIYCSSVQYLYLHVHSQLSNMYE